MASPEFRAHPGEPLSERTSVRLGGPAEFFARVDDAEMLARALDWAEARGLEVTVLGGGSNVVVADAGLPGLVLELGARAESVEDRAGREMTVRVGAGADWDAFVARAVERGWAGVECLSGIPGQVGATPIQNVGAYGQEVAGTIAAVEVLDRATREHRVLMAAECGFGYRTSRFKSGDGRGFIVLSVTFRLIAGGAACLAYPEIARRFTSAGAPSLAEVRRAVLATRAAKSMLLDANDENGRSCGSFFVNPQLTPAELDALRARAPVAPPVFAQADGRFKVPAAWLIEQSGFERGQRFGAIGISSRHCLALVCHEGASAGALVSAAHRVRDGVAERFGVWLEPEPRFLGFDSSDGGLPRDGGR